MTDDILEKMTRGVYYPGRYLGKKIDLKDMVAKGYLERMDGSFLCGPDSPPNYCLTDEGCLQKHKKKQLKFATSPTEKTTAITDILLSLVAAGAISCLQQLESPESWKINTWSMAFGFMALSGLLGAVAHGIEMPEAAHRHTWSLLNLSLGLAVSAFVIGVTYDVWGVAIARMILPWMMVLALGFYLVTRLFAGIFFVFIVYEAAALLFAWGAYSWLALTGQLEGALLMSVGVLVSIVAAGTQATLKTTVKLIFEFDHNGIFHIVQILGIMILLAGLRLSLR